jgi:hypothetical protein
VLAEVAAGPIVMAWADTGAVRERPSLLGGRRQGRKVTKVATILSHHRDRLVSLPLVSALLTLAALVVFGPVISVFGA